MKKHALLITFVIASILVASLVGCGPKPTEAPEATPEPEVTEAPTPEATEPPAPPEPVTLRYANWNLGTEEENNMQRQLIKAYTDLYPHVTIEFVDMSAEGGWEANLTAYAAKGELPDVFAANNVPLYVKNGWLADLTELTSTDADWANVPQALKDAFTYSGVVYGMPSAMFIMGYWVNQDLYEAANLDAPAYGISVDDFFAVAEELNDPANGVLGLDEQEFVMGWYANTQDPNLKWFSFDGNHMNYNSAAFKAAVAKTGEIKPLTWQGLTDEQKANFISGATGIWDAFLNQEVGVRWDASWNVPGWLQNATFNWDFVGIPGGNQALVFDMMGVSSTTANLQEAYNFAKWMSFSSDAWAVEAELATAANSAPKMPLSTDPAALELYKAFVDKPGINAALANLDNSLLESLAKVVPGYINARWEGKPGIDIGEDKDVNMWYMFNFANDGRYKYEDYSAQLETFANQIIDAAKAELNP